MILNQTLLIFFLILLHGFFVAVEYATAVSYRIQLNILSDINGRIGQITSRWLGDLKRRERMISTAQTCVIFTSLALGVVGLRLFDQLLGPLTQKITLPPSLSFLSVIFPALPFLCTLLAVGGLNNILGEQLPKMLALESLERFVLLAVPVMRVLSTLLSPFTRLLAGTASGLAKALGISSIENDSSAYSLAEIKQMVSHPEIAGNIEEPEREMLTAVIDFGEMLVRQLCIPRTEVVAVEADTPVDDVVRLAIETGVTKLPVYKGDLDQVLGIVHLRDMVRIMQNGNANGSTARDLARETLFVPETIFVNDLLRQFRDERKHIAIVLDEFGGTAGLVTLEDLLEEIVGDVQDPFEAGQPLIEELPDGSALIEGKALIEEVNEYFSLQLVDEDYDTLAGYMLGKLGRIPKEGDVAYDWDQGIHLTVEKMDRMRIAQITLKRF